MGTRGEGGGRIGVGWHTGGEITGHYRASNEEACHAVGMNPNVDRFARVIVAAYVRTPR